MDETPNVELPPEPPFGAPSADSPAAADAPAPAPAPVSPPGPSRLKIVAGAVAGLLGGAAVALGIGAVLHHDTTGVRDQVSQVATAGGDQLAPGTTSFDPRGSARGFGRGDSPQPPTGPTSGPMTRSRGS